MSVKKIMEYAGQGRVLFGIRQCLKNKKRTVEVFVAKDSRGETLDSLKSSGIEFGISRTKSEIADELNLDFECEVFSIIK